MQNVLPFLCTALSSFALGIFFSVQFDNRAAAKALERSPTCERRIFPAEVLRTIDGDTIEVMIDQGLGNYRKTAVRLVSIDTPEVFGPKVDRDPVRGPAATEFTKAWVAQHINRVELFVHGDDKYGGRIDADVYPAGGGQRLSDALREAGHEK